MKNPHSGLSEVVDVPIPIAIGNYNKYMGGVDKSDQFLSYNRLLRKTVRYRKTMFYHLLEIIGTNCSIINNWQRMATNKKKRSQTEFRDRLVQHIIAKYGHPAPPPQSSTVHHGSCFSSPLERKWCVLCHNQKTHRICPDCPYQPSLCQVAERDCHSLWHKTESAQIRKAWLKRHKRGGVFSLSTTSTTRGRPKGSKNLKKRRGNYRKSI